MFFKQSPERFPEISDRSRRIECRTLMKKLLTVSVFLLLWSMQAFGSQSKLSQFSALTPKRRAALQARLAARAQAGYAARRRVRRLAMRPRRDVPRSLPEV